MVGSSGALSTSAPLFVGAAYIIYPTGSPVSITRFFDGSIHDVGVYNRGLSANEIRVNFLNTEFKPTVVPPDLLSYKMTAAEAQQTNTSRIVLTDYSTGGEHTGYGQCFNGSHWLWTNNVVGAMTALHFNGSDSVLTVTNSSTAFNFTTNPFTVNLWAMPLTESTCIMQNGGITNGWYITEGDYTGIFGWNTPASGSYIAAPTGKLSNEQWNMLTCVWNGTNAFIYIDGLQVGVSGSFSAPASSVYNLVFGVDGAGANRLDGDIWLTQIWSAALLPTDIANLCFQQIKGNAWP